MIRPFRERDTGRVVAIGRAAGLLRRPWNDPYEDISREQTMSDGLFLVTEQDGTVVGTVMAGFDGHRGGSTTWPWTPSHRATAAARP